MKLNAIAAVLLIVLGPLVSGEANNTIKDQIVVNTPLQNYEQPSLRDYEECQTNRQSCMDICAGSEKCQSECPLCPELSDEPLLVQGVNDTSYVPPVQPVLNTTNIIRLTNEINNIIKTDLQARNELNVKVHQNVSQVGGRFGLGYTERGSCCYVVVKSKECEHKEHCEETSRQRVCGGRCQARVMIARRVVQCDKDQPEECHETVEYVPARKHKSRGKNHSTRCRSTGNTWPYISCSGQDQSSVRNRRSNCQDCLSLSYGYILQNGLPPQCAGCFQDFAAPMMTVPMWYAPMPNFGYNYQPQLEPQDQDQDQDQDQINNNDGDVDAVSDSGWQLESQKCLNAKGQLEDCPGDHSLEPLPPGQLVQGKNDDDYYVPAQRRRRRQSHRQFVRSLYNHRNVK